MISLINVLEIQSVHNQIHIYQNMQMHRSVNHFYQIKYVDNNLLKKVANIWLLLAVSILKKIVNKIKSQSVFGLGMIALVCFNVDVYCVVGLNLQSKHIKIANSFLHLALSLSIQMVVFV